MRRGLGNFWDFRKPDLFAASIFDMAIYPTLFVFISSRWPHGSAKTIGIYAGLLVVAACHSQSRASRRRHHFSGFFSLVTLRMVVLVTTIKVGALRSCTAAAGTSLGLLGGVLVAM